MLLGNKLCYEWEKQTHAVRHTVPIARRIFAKADKYLKQLCMVRGGMFGLCTPPYFLYDFSTAWFRPDD